MSAARWTWEDEREALRDASIAELLEIIDEGLMEIAGVKGHETSWAAMDVLHEKLHDRRLIDREGDGWR